MNWEPFEEGNWECTASKRDSVSRKGLVLVLVPPLPMLQCDLKAL